MNSDRPFTRLGEAQVGNLGKDKVVSKRPEITLRQVGDVAVVRDMSRQGILPLLLDEILQDRLVF